MLTSYLVSILRSSFISGDRYICIHPKELKPVSQRASCAHMLTDTFFTLAKTEQQLLEGISDLLTLY